MKEIIFKMPVYYKWTNYPTIKDKIFGKIQISLYDPWKGKDFLNTILNISFLKVKIIYLYHKKL